MFIKMIILFSMMFVLSLQQCSQKPYLLLQNISGVFNHYVTGVSISPDGKYIVAAKGWRSFSKSAVLFKFNGRVFNRMGSELFSIPKRSGSTLPTRKVENMFSTDSSKLLLSSSKFTIYNLDNITDLSSSVAQQTIQIPDIDLLYSDISADGKILLASAMDKYKNPYTYIFRLNDKKFTKTQQLPNPLKFQGVKISPNGRYLVTFNSQDYQIPAIIQIHVQDPNKIGQYLPPVSLSINSTQYQFRVGLTNDILIVAGSNFLKVFNRTSTGFTQKQHLKITDGFPQSIKITNDENKIFLTNNNGFTIFALNSQLEYYQVQKVNVGAFVNDIDISANNNYLVIGNDNCSLCRGNEGKYINGNSCLLSQQNCKTYESVEICLSCFDQFYLDGFQCKKCDVNCKTCSLKSTNCQSCNQNFVLNALKICLPSTPSTSDTTNNNVLIIAWVLISLLLVGIIIATFCIFIRLKLCPNLFDSQQDLEVRDLPKPESLIIGCFCLSDNPVTHQSNVCLHTFHLLCITQWIKRKQTCPNCRKILKLPYIIKIQNLILQQNVA